MLAALSPATLERLARPRVAIAAQGRHYGYGVVVDRRRGPRLVLHTGGKALPAVPVGADRFYVKGGGQLETFVIVRDARRVPRFLCAETWALRKRS